MSSKYTIMATYEGGYVANKLLYSNLETIVTLCNN